MTSFLRFRRWGRVGYAVFRSLGKNVTIGNLTTAIADKSLQKSNCMDANICNRYTDTTECNDLIDELELEFTSIAWRVETLSAVNADCVTARVYIIFYKYLIFNNG
ncbi:MAG: hypothetical protein ACK5KP_02530 [Paludibacteraceae bacterium]